jgi:hypothetical protein
MGCLEGSGVPVLYIGRTVPKVNADSYPVVHLCVNSLLATMVTLITDGI